MGIIINTGDCIGCGVCVQISPQTFSLNEDQGKAVVISEELTSSAKEAVDSCPVSAIIASEK
jgi:ferredoxin